MIKGSELAKVVFSSLDQMWVCLCETVYLIHFTGVRARREEGGERVMDLLVLLRIFKLSTKWNNSEKYENNHSSTKHSVGSDKRPKLVVIVTCLLVTV